MANEIQFGFRTSATLTYGAYQPDGTARTAAGTSLPEIGTTGYYTATDGSVVAGDAVIVIESPNVVGYGVYQPEATVANISDVQNGLATEAKQDIIDTNVDTIEANIGTPEDIDSGGATLADNLKKIVDDNGGADFDATTDSLEKIRIAVDTSASGAPLID